MTSFRSMLRPLLSPALKRRAQQLLLGYHSYAPSFSSAGEDMILRHIIGSDKHNGFFVDVGAYHPTLFSNTYFFYLHGWRGLNIEARPGSKALFDRVRPRDINVEIGIASKRGELTYYLIGEDSTMNSFSKEFLEYLGILNEVRRELPVMVVPLNEALKTYLPDGQPIDFMNVDVEGNDLEALQSNDWQRYRPRFVLVEDKSIDPEKSDIVRFMCSCGYELCVQNVIILGKVNEYIFVDQSSLNHNKGIDRL